MRLLRLLAAGLAFIACSHAAAADLLPITGIQVDAGGGIVDVAVAQFVTTRSASGLVGGRVTHTPIRFHTYRFRSEGGVGTPAAFDILPAKAEAWMNNLGQGALCSADDPCCVGQRFAAGASFAAVDHSPRGPGAGSVAATIYLAASGAGLQLAAANRPAFGNPPPPTARSVAGKSTRDEVAAFNARLTDLARMQFERIDKALNAPDPPTAWPTLDAAAAATPARHCPRAWIGWAGKLPDGYATLEIRADEEIYLSVDFVPDRAARGSARRYACRVAGRLGDAFRDRCGTR